MPEFVIRARDNGPLVVSGDVVIVDAQGNAFRCPTDKPVVALCRCGHSAKKPFCDGSHRDCGFEACERADEGSD